MNTIEYYKNRILSALEEYKTINDIEDLHRISKTRWKAALRFVYESVFKPEARTGKQRRCIIPYSRIDILDGLSDEYINLCNEYNKDISLYGYSILIGIDYHTLLQWLHSKTRSSIYIDNTTGKVVQSNLIEQYRKIRPDAEIEEVPNTLYINVCQKLTAERQESLRSLSLDGSIPALALGKIEYGWIEGGLQQKQAELIEQSRAAADLLQEYKRGMIEERKE